MKPFAVEREIEDLAALIDACGGSASLWGWSSGGALAPTGRGRRHRGREGLFTRCRSWSAGSQAPTPDYGERLDELVAADDRSGAVKHFMRNAMGIPAPFVALIRLTPRWKEVKATAHTLPLRLGGSGEPHDVRRAAVARGVVSVRAPTLVVHGDKTPELLRAGSEALAQVPPNAELRCSRERATTSDEEACSVLAEFFAGGETQP